MHDLDIIGYLLAYELAFEDDIFAAVPAAGRQGHLKSEPVEYLRDRSFDVAPFQIASAPESCAMRRAKRSLIFDQCSYALSSQDVSTKACPASGWPRSRDRFDL